MERPAARDRLGWPSISELHKVLNAGGTQQELVAVVPGSPEFVDGIRVLFGLRFSDGISFVAWRSQGLGSSLWKFELRDDLGVHLPRGAERLVRPKAARDLANRSAA